MYIRSIGVNLDKSKKLWGIIFCAVLVAVILISLTFFHVFKEGDIIGDTSFTKTQLFQATKYAATYQMTVFSNKNQNTYQMKEWYQKKGDSYQFRIETDNEIGNYVYLGDNHRISIQSPGQINALQVDGISTKTNVISIATFIELYQAISDVIDNKKVAKKSCCKLEAFEEDDQTRYCVTLDRNSQSRCDICSKYRDIVESGMKIGKFELIVNNKKQTPVEYIVYTTDDKSYLDVLYNNFVINADFDEKLFAF